MDTKKLTETNFLLARIMNVLEFDIRLHVRDSKLTGLTGLPEKHELAIKKILKQWKTEVEQEIKDIVKG